MFKSPPHIVAQAASRAKSRTADMVVHRLHCIAFKRCRLPICSFEQSNHNGRQTLRRNVHSLAIRHHHIHVLPLLGRETRERWQVLGTLSGAIRKAVSLSQRENYDKSRCFHPLALPILKSPLDPLDWVVKTLTL